MSTRRYRELHSENSMSFWTGLRKFMAVLSSWCLLYVSFGQMLQTRQSHMGWTNTFVNAVAPVAMACDENLEDCNGECVAEGTCEGLDDIECNEGYVKNEDGTCMFEGEIRTFEAADIGMYAAADAISFIIVMGISIVSIFAIISCTQPEANSVSTDTATIEIPDGSCGLGAYAGFAGGLLLLANEIQAMIRGFMINNELKDEVEYNHNAMKYYKSYCGEDGTVDDANLPEGVTSADDPLGGGEGGDGGSLQDYCNQFHGLQVQLDIYTDMKGIVDTKIGMLWAATVTLGIAFIIEMIHQGIVSGSQVAATTTLTTAATGQACFAECSAGCSGTPPQVAACVGVCEVEAVACSQSYTAAEATAAGGYAAFEASCEAAKSGSDVTAATQVASITSAMIAQIPLDAVEATTDTTSETTEVAATTRCETCATIEATYTEASDICYYAMSAGGPLCKQVSEAYDEALEQLHSAIVSGCICPETEAQDETEGAEGQEAPEAEVEVEVDNTPEGVNSPQGPPPGLRASIDHFNFNGNLPVPVPADVKGGYYYGNLPFNSNISSVKNVEKKEVSKPAIKELPPKKRKTASSSKHDDVLLRDIYIPGATTTVADIFDDYPFNSDKLTIGRIKSFNNPIPPEMRSFVHERTSDALYKTMLPMVYSNYDSIYTFFESTDMVEDVSADNFFLLRGKANRMHLMTLMEQTPKGENLLNYYYSYHETKRFTNGESQSISVDEYEKLNPFIFPYEPEAQSGLDNILAGMAFGENAHAQSGGFDVWGGFKAARLTVIIISVIVLLVKGRDSFFDGYMSKPWHRGLSWLVGGILIAACALWYQLVVAPDLQERIDLLNGILDQVAEVGEGSGAGLTDGVTGVVPTPDPTPPPGGGEESNDVPIPDIVQGCNPPQVPTGNGGCADLSGNTVDLLNNEIGEPGAAVAFSALNDALVGNNGMNSGKLSAAAKGLNKQAGNIRRRMRQLAAKNAAVRASKGFSSDPFGDAKKVASKITSGLNKGRGAFTKAMGFGKVGDLPGTDPLAGADGTGKDKNDPFSDMLKKSGKGGAGGGAGTKGPSAFNFSLDDPDTDLGIAALDAGVDEDVDLSDLDIDQNDISGNKGASIWKMLSNRYQRSAYPVFFEEVK